MFSGLAANAAIWQETLQLELNLGERDTRVAIRAAALEEMRNRASQRVGMIVESTMVSTGTRLTEEIRMISVSLVKIDNVKDELKIQKDGSARLSVVALVTVDTTELDRRAVAMRTDAVKAERIRQLAADNQALRGALDDITRQLGQQGTASAAADLLKRQATILDNLSTNSLRVGQTFLQGALIDLAQKDEQAWQGIVTELETGVFAKLLGAPVTAKIVRVENDQSNVNVLVQVGWMADHREIVGTLKRYINGVEETNNRGESNGGLFTSWGHANSVHSNHPYSERVFNLLISSEVKLEIAVGGARRLLPVLFDGSGFGFACDVTVPWRVHKVFEGTGAVCISFLEKGSAKVKGLGNGHDANPVKLVLTKPQAQVATEVTATWIWRKPDGTEMRQPAPVL
jgi:hypothetical protein